jgi:hypothetical protein
MKYNFIINWDNLIWFQSEYFGFKKLKQKKEFDDQRRKNLFNITIQNNLIVNHLQFQDIYYT